MIIRRILMGFAALAFVSTAWAYSSMTRPLSPAHQLVIATPTATVVPDSTPDVPVAAGGVVLSTSSTSVIIHSTAKSEAATEDEPDPTVEPTVMPAPLGTPVPEPTPWPTIKPVPTPINGCGCPPQQLGTRYMCPLIACVNRD